MMTRSQSESEPAHSLQGNSWSHCEDAIEAFEQAWRAGSSPRIEDYLRVEDAQRVSLLIELAHVDLELRLKAGQPARVESYLREFPSLAQDSVIVLDLLAAEYELRRRQDSSVALDEYAGRFPAYVDDLRERLLPASLSTGAAASGQTKAASRALPEVPGYDILNEIGRGGMGIIYKARQARLKRLVALKFLPDEMIRDKSLLDRFLREAVTASSLNHPNICTVHELGEQAGRPFIVMEFIAGETLKAVGARQPSVAEACRLMWQAARALSAAHAAGVVHRDVKPENIMVRGDGYVKVLDFGLARRLPTLTQHDTRGANDTAPGALLGTVAYMSPEQARGETMESPSDIFSLGVVFYQLVTGRHPFESDSAFSTLHAIVSERPIAPARLCPEVPRDLSGLIEAMLNKDAVLRPAAHDIEQALANPNELHEQGAGPVPASRPIVHRHPELTALRAALAAVEAGSGRLLCVTGEPGIGKTTLVEDFLAELAESHRVGVIARGRCSERQAGTEAFLPVFEALSGMIAGDSSGSVARLMKVLAPTWFDQLTRRTQPSDPLSPRAASQHAMLREFCNLLEELSRISPVVLFLDDVHWADLSTVDLLSHFGRHRQSLRVLVIVTFRPTEMLLGPHPFHGVKLDLQSQGACNEVAVGFLSREDIDRYLSLAFPGHSFGADFADLVFSRTEGSPLFMADMLAYLREQGVIYKSDGHWSLAKELPDLRKELPQSVRSMIERKFEQLSEDDRRLLQAAAARGYEFDSATVSAAIDRDPATVEVRLQALERIHRVVRLLGESEYPDRTLTLRYVFVHVLYQQALADETGLTRRASLSLALARSLERHHGTSSTAGAAETACLYEAGRDYAGAARHFQLAAQNAAHVFAHRDAIALAQRGLDLLETVPASPERDELELSLQMHLGLQIQVTEGYAADLAKQSYDRARALCPVDERSKRLFPILWGQWLYYKVRSRLLRAQELADELFALARTLNEPDLALQAHQALGITALCRGNQTEALRHVEQVAALYNPERHSEHAAVFGQDPAVICKAFGAIALWLMGFPDAARRQSESAIAMSRNLSPTSQSIALHFAAMLHQLCRNPGLTRKYAEASMRIATEHGLSFWLAGGRVLHGWSLAAMRDTEAGIRQLRQGVIAWQATGSATYRTYYLALLAEALASSGNVSTAQGLLDEALALADRTDERFFEPELHRLSGDLHTKRSGAPGLTSIAMAEAAYRRALDLSSRQDAKSLQLRALMSLARLDMSRANSDVHRHLTETLAAFSQGLDTPDLQEASALVKSWTHE